jgi:hypothetical protein
MTTVLNIQNHRLLGDWRAIVHQWRWFTTGLAVLVGAATLVAMGTPLAPAQGERKYIAPLAYNVLQFGFPLVFAVLWADRAADRGVHPVWAYGAAVIGVAIVGTWPIARLLWPVLGKEPYWGIDNDMWLAGNAVLFHSLGVAAYAQWRGFHVAQARLQQGERARAEQQQQLVSAQLLALQARVDPQLLFDSLRRIEHALAAAPDEADQQLAELIELLRALQPAVHAKTSTVAREVAVVRAYARVAGEPGLAAPWLLIEMSDQAGDAALAPMVLLPLLRQLATQPGWAWQLRGTVTAQRLRLLVTAPSAGPASTLAALAAIDIPTLSQRLHAVHGAASVFQVDAEQALPQLRIEVNVQPKDAAP